VIHDRHAKLVFKMTKGPVMSGGIEAGDGIFVDDDAKAVVEALDRRVQDANVGAYACEMNLGDPARAQEQGEISALKSTVAGFVHPVDRVLEFLIDALDRAV